MTGARAALALALALAAGPAPADDRAPCRVEVSVEPARVFVGEQAVYRARVLRLEGVREVRWLRAPSFPSLRSEWLPGRAVDPRIAGVVDAFLVSEDRRALFPVRAGTIEIPPAVLGCRLASGAELEVAAAGATLVAVPPPEAARPADFAGVVGPVEVRAHVSTRRLQLGETLRLAVVLVGAGNLWAAAAPLDPGGPELDAYPEAPELQLESGERLRVRRTFVWELVPRRAGPFALPAPRVPWLDPATGRYAVAEGPALQVTVRPAAPARQPLAPEAPRPGPDQATPERRGGLALGVLLTAGAGALAALCAWRRAGPLRAGAPALARAERALAAGAARDAVGALAAALRAGLGRRVAGSEALAAEEIAARAGGAGPVAEAAALLAELDRWRFAGAGESGTPPSPQRVRAALRALGSARRLR